MNQNDLIELAESKLQDAKNSTLSRDADKQALVQSHSLMSIAASLLYIIQVMEQDRKAEQEQLDEYKRNEPGFSNNFPG